MYDTLPLPLKRGYDLLSGLLHVRATAL